MSRSFRLGPLTSYHPCERTALAIYSRIPFRSQLRLANMSSNKGASNADAYNSAALDSVNSKLLAGGAADGVKSFPSVTLPGGRTIRTGTVATLLHNINLYNQADSRAKSGGPDAEAAKAELETLEEEMRLAVPTLKEVGMFELFPTDEWMSGGTAGRQLVGRIAKEMGH